MFIKKKYITSEQILWNQRNGVVNIIVDQYQIHKHVSKNNKFSENEKYFFRIWSIVQENIPFQFGSKVIKY